MARAYIGLGSNLGDPREFVREAARRLATHGRVVAASSLYETEPWGGIAQPRFINAACVLETSESPQQLMRSLLEIERALGRDRATEERWGPRRIDLDLLLYEDLILRTDDLVLPHPRLPERAFALVPLAEVAPDVRHPVTGQTARELAASVGSTGVRRLPETLAPDL